MPIDPSIPLQVQHANIIGNTLASLSQMRQQQAQEQEAARQRRREEQADQSLEEQRAARTKLSTDQTAAAGAATSPDWDTAIQSLSPEQRVIAEKIRGELETHRDARRKAAAKQRAAAARGIAAFNYDPSAAEFAFAAIAEDDPQAAELWAQVKDDPAKLKQIVDFFIQQDPDYKPPAAPTDFSLGPGQTRFGPDGKPIASIPVTPPAEPRVTFQAPQTHMVNGKRTLVRPGSDGQMYDMRGQKIAADIQPVPEQGPQPPTVGSFEDFVTRRYGKNPTADQIEDARRTYQSASRPGIEIDAEMPPAYQTALERAIGSIPAARRGTWVQTANRLWKEGNEAELKSVIKQAAIEAEDVTTKNQVRNRQATMAALDDVEVMLGDLKAAGVPTGWLSGTSEDLMRRIGRSTDPRLVAIRNRMADTLINYRRAATGAAFSAAESADYERMFPNYRQQLPVNLAAIQGLKRAMRTNDQVFWEGKLGKAGAALVGATTEQRSGGTVKIESITEIK